MRVPVRKLPIYEASVDKLWRHGRFLFHHARKEPPILHGLVTVIGPRPSGRLDEVPARAGSFIIRRRTGVNVYGC
jgi:hypothetical protein